MRGISGLNADGDISKWSVGRVTSMKEMFYLADEFNGDLSNWDTSQVTNMKVMFFSADEFNGDLSKWNVGRVTSMKEMFYGTDEFNIRIWPFVLYEYKSRWDAMI